MQENDFEKQMREQLNELNIVPSDAVWDKVSHRITPKVIPWRKGWMSAAAILIIGLGFWWTTSKNGNGLVKNEEKLVANNEQAAYNMQETTSSTSRIVQDKQQDAGNVAENERIAEAGEEKINVNQRNNQVPNAALADINTASKGKTIANASAVIGNIKHKSNRTETTSPAQQSKNPTHIAANSKNSTIEAGLEKGATMPIAATKKEELAQNKENIGLENNLGIESYIEKSEDNAALAEVSKSLLATRKEDSSDYAKSLIASQLRRSIAASSPIKPRTEGRMKTLPIDHLIVDKSTASGSGKGDWVFGMNASFGVTIPATSVFNKPVSSPVSYDMAAQSYRGSNFISSPAYAPPAYAPMPAASEPGANMGFTVGALVGKNISERVAIMTGLQYAQQSTSYSTGTFVDQANYVMQNGVNTRVSNYYQNGSRIPYTSRYHFAELPVDISYAFAQQTKLPLFVHGGGTLGYLVSSNALIYSEADGIYYKSLSELNRTQAEVQFGLNMQLMESSSGRVMIGPLLKYNVTPIRGGGTFSTKPDHLSYAGMKFSYYFK